MDAASLLVTATSNSSDSGQRVETYIMLGWIIIFQRKQNANMEPLCGTFGMEKEHAQRAHATMDKAIWRLKHVDVM